jgi:hypothetical protein
MESDNYWYEDDILVVHGVMHMDKRMWFLDDYTGITLPGWFNPDWIPDEGNVAWIYDFVVVDCEIRISPDEMKYDNGLNDNWVYGSTLQYRNYS